MQRFVLSIAAACLIAAADALVVGGRVVAIGQAQAAPGRPQPRPFMKSKEDIEFEEYAGPPLPSLPIVAHASPPPRGH